MTILKRAGSVLVTGAALAGMLALSASSAVAATNAGVAATWTVKPGGAITAKAGKTTLTDTNTGSTLTCTSSSGKGTVKKGSGLSGTGIGSITSLALQQLHRPAEPDLHGQDHPLPLAPERQVLRGRRHHGHHHRHPRHAVRSWLQRHRGRHRRDRQQRLVTAKYSNSTGKLSHDRRRQPARL